MRVGIIGTGTIGSILSQKIQEMGWDIFFTVNSKGVYRNGTRIDSIENYHLYVSPVDMGFLAIPSSQQEAAYRYMLQFLAWGKPIVTCEKGALANYFSELHPKLHKIGYSATVGGGTQMLRYLEDMKQRGILEINGVVNGTLNYIFSRIEKKDRLETIIKGAQEKGLTEPGATDYLEIINNELCSDVVRKTTILYNLCFPTSPIRANDIAAKPLTERDLRDVVLSRRRCVVSIAQKKADIIGGFIYEASNWIISVGFQQSHHMTFPLPCFEDNALSIKTNDGTYTVMGPGAGPKPTVAAMIGDARRIICQKYTTSFYNQKIKPL